MIDIKSISVIIRNARIDQKLTNQKLAEKAGLSNLYVRRLQSGDVNPSIEVLNKVFKALELDSSLLIDNKSVRKPKKNHATRAMFFGLYSQKYIFNDVQKCCYTYREWLDITLSCGGYVLLYDLKDLPFYNPELGFDIKPHLDDLSPIMYDLLRYKGYALPWMGLSVDDLIEYGWVKLMKHE